MSYFAILHKPTNKFLPRSKYRRGGTYVEIEKGGLPRLFANRTAAANALRWWLAGQYSCHMTYDFEGGDYLSEKVIPVPSRNAEDMVIVEIELTQKQRELAP